MLVKAFNLKQYPEDNTWFHTHVDISPFTYPVMDDTDLMTDQQKENSYRLKRSSRYVQMLVCLDHPDGHTARDRNIDSSCFAQNLNFGDSDYNSETKILFLMRFSIGQGYGPWYKDGRPHFSPHAVDEIIAQQLNQNKSGKLYSEGTRYPLSSVVQEAVDPSQPILKRFTVTVRKEEIRIYEKDFLGTSIEDVKCKAEEKIKAQGGVSGLWLFERREVPIKNEIIEIKPEESA